MDSKYRLAEVFFKEMGSREALREGLIRKFLR